MTTENYINIQGWMVVNMELKSNDLILYAIIYGFTQDGVSEYYGSLRYISKATLLQKSTVASVIERLIKKGFIKRTSESHYVTTGVRKSKQLKGGTKKRTRGTKKRTQAVRKTVQITNNTNNKSNNKDEQSSIEKNKSLKIQEDKVIEVFYKSINPTINFGNRTTRKACKDLIKRFGFDKVKEVAVFACSLHGKPYAPVITTPYELKEKMSKLKAYADRLREEANQNSVVEL